MEEFSVSELEEYRKHGRQNDREALEDLVSKNLAISGIRSYDLEPDLTEMKPDRALAYLLHDSVIDLYQENREMSSEEIYDRIAEKLNRRISETEGLNQDIVLGRVHGMKVGDAASEIADYYSDNFEQASQVETEKVLENNGLYGRTDVVRQLDDTSEIRDVKIHYSGIPVPVPGEEFRMASYALISRDDLDVDRFVLEYPLQREEVEVKPENWFAEVTDTAADFEELLEEARENQAELLKDEVGSSTKASREFVESLNLPYNLNLKYAEQAVKGLD
ncbi:MAG: hypothetical protein ABEK00_01850 [Candidatus Nanohaloarchaea archaeon]